LLSFYDKKHSFISKNFEIKTALSAIKTAIDECCFENSIYHYAVNEGADSLFIISNLSEIPVKTNIEGELLANGIKSIAIIPLIKKDE